MAKDHALTKLFYEKFLLSRLYCREVYSVRVSLILRRHLTVQTENKSGTLNDAIVCPER